jgi:hypothetical protein
MFRIRILGELPANLHKEMIRPGPRRVPVVISVLTKARQVKTRCSEGLPGLQHKSLGTASTSTPCPKAQTMVAGVDVGEISHVVGMVAIVEKLGSACPDVRQQKTRSPQSKPMTRA